MPRNIVALRIQEKDDQRFLSIRLLPPNWDKDNSMDVALTALALAVAGLVFLLLVQLAPQWVGPLLELLK